MTNITLYRLSPKLAAGLLLAGLSIAGVAAGQESPPPGPSVPPFPPASFTPPPPLQLPPGFRPPPPPPGFPMPQAPGPDARPADLKAGPAALKLVKEAAASFAAGQVWVRPAPPGQDQMVEASVLYQNREVARLRFNAADAMLLPKGYHESPFNMMPPFFPGEHGPRGHHGPPPPPNGGPGPYGSNDSVPPPPPGGGNPPGGAPPPPPPLMPPPGGPPSAGSAGPGQPAANLEAVKNKLGEIVKQLTVANGAEIAGRDSVWRVPLIHEEKIVGEVSVSGDGTRVLPDVAAARDAAIFAR